MPTPATRTAKLNSTTLKEWLDQQPAEMDVFVVDKEGERTKVSNIRAAQTFDEDGVFFMVDETFLPKDTFISSVAPDDADRIERMRVEALSRAIQAYGSEFATSEDITKRAGQFFTFLKGDA